MRINNFHSDKLHGFFVLFSLMALMVFTACATEGEDSSQEENNTPVMQQEEQAQPQNQPQTNIETQPQGNTTSQVTDENGDVVFHFVCPNGCEGSGGPGKAPCPVCGAEYVHNSEYHQYQNQQQDQQPVISPQSDGQIQTQQPSATNAQGEYHFICPEGCEGGSATKTTCGNCGAELVHNDDYH